MNKKNIANHAGWISRIIVVVMVLIVSVLAFWALRKWNLKQIVSEHQNEISMKSYTDEDIEEEGDIHYVSSQILVTAIDAEQYGRVYSFAKKKNADIVGCIYETGDFQIEIKEEKTYEELCALVDEFNKEEFVQSAMLHYVEKTEVESVDYTNDMWKASWQILPEAPKGKNWWAEAINMPRVWSSDIEFRNINVGVMDSMFDTDHEDLEGKFAWIENNPTGEGNTCAVCEKYTKSDDSEVKRKSRHGTHVTGIIAANGGNGCGITGIAENANIYAYAINGKSNWSSVYHEKYVIAAMLHQQVRVINHSMGNTLDFVGRCMAGEADAIEELRQNSNNLSLFLHREIDLGYDFLIVQAAGNDGYDAKYNHGFCYIDDPVVRSRIIVVGAVKNDFLNEIPGKDIASPSIHIRKSYAIVDTFNYGERIDVYVPGKDIYSTVPQNGYKKLSGTSMAAPMVTGIISLIYGVNPDLTAEQVRTILLQSAGYQYIPIAGSETRNIVDTWYCVQRAQELIGSRSVDQFLNRYGSVRGVFAASSYDDNGRIIHDADGDIETTLLTGVSAKLYRVNDNDEHASTIDTSTFSGDTVDGSYLECQDYFISETAGNYRIVASKEGYVTVTEDIEIMAGTVSDKEIVLKPVSTTGRVLDVSSGEALMDIQVIARQGETEVSATTNENGEYRLVIPAGDYELSICNDEFENYEAEFTAKEGEETVIENIELIKHALKEATWNEPCKCTICGKVFKESIKDTVFRRYAEVITDLETQYGKCTIKSLEYNEYFKQEYYSGLCYAELLDMDGDGREEMITVVGTSRDSYKLTVYGYDGESVISSTTSGKQCDIGFHCYDGGEKWISIWKKNGKFYIESGAEDSFYFAYLYTANSGGKLYLYQEFESEDYYSDFSIDGFWVTESEWNEKLDEYSTYRYIPLNTQGASDKKSSVDSIIRETKEKLGV